MNYTFAHFIGVNWTAENHRILMRWSVPVLNDLRQYLEKIAVEVLPKSEAGKAIAYIPKNWPALLRYTEDGDLSIDNNRTERSLRGISVGRKN